MEKKLLIAFIVVSGNKGETSEAFSTFSLTFFGTFDNFEHHLAAI